MMDNFFDDNATPSFGKALLDILRITAAHKENLQSLVLLVLYNGCCIHSYMNMTYSRTSGRLCHKHLFAWNLQFVLLTEGLGGVGG